eukprot:scaffold3761_cov372-Prasinococcus_capsulatus_cf.AAC.25
MRGRRSGVSVFFAKVPVQPLSAGVEAYAGPQMSSVEAAFSDCSVAVTWGGCVAWKPNQGRNMDA